MVRMLALILGLQLLGEALAETFALPLPGPVIGMVTLFALLWIWEGPPPELDGITRGLLDNLGLLFVPAGVGVTAHLHILGRDWAALLLAIVVATVISIAVVGKLFEAIAARSAPQVRESDDG